MIAAMTTAALPCIAAPVARPIVLERDATWSFIPGRGRVRVACRRGTVWLTIAGDPRDRILGAGDHLIVEGRGRVAVQALEDAEVWVRPAEY